MIVFRKIAIIITIGLCVVLIMASWFGQYAFKSNTSVWFVLLLAVGMCLCFRYLTDFRFNLALIMSFFVWMGLILRLAIIQFKGNVDAFVQFGDLTGPEYNRAALYICLACGSSLLGIVLAGQTEREENETTPGRYSRIYFGVLLILGVAAIAQLFYLFYLTPILNMFSVYRPGDFLEKVLAYFRSEFFVLSLFAFAIWLIRPLDPQYLRRWKALPMIGRRLLLVIVIVYPLTRLLGGNRGFLFEEFLQLSFAALAVYNFGDLRLKINVARVFLVIIAVVISSMGWFVVEEIRKEAFSGNTLNSVNVTSIINGATENYDFSYFLAVASARVYLLDPTVLPINDEYFTSPDAYLTIDQSLKRAVNRITPASSIKPFEVNLEESELAYYRLYHVGTEQQRQSYTAPGLSYLTFGWWGGLAFMFGLSFVVTRIYKYFLNLKNRIHSVIACSILMYFYYEWWQTFGFDNLAYKLVWTSLTLWLILFLVGVLVGRRNRTADTADQKKPEVRPDGLMAVS